MRGMKTLEDRKEEQEKKAFQEDITYFLGKETFTMHDFHERVLVTTTSHLTSIARFEAKVHSEVNGLW